MRWRFNSIAIVEAYLKALAEGNIPGLFSLFAPDVKWHQPGENKFSGIKNRLGEIGNMIGGMMQDAAGTLVVKPNGALMESDQLVACPVRFTAAKGSKKIDMTGIDLFEVKEGKITQVWLFSQDQRGEDAFWQD